MSIVKTRSASLSKQQLLIVKKALKQYINFNVSATSPQMAELKVILNVLDNQLLGY